MCHSCLLQVNNGKEHFTTLHGKVRSGSSLHSHRAPRGCIDQPLLATVAIPYTLSTLSSSLAAWACSARADRTAFCLPPCSPRHLVHPPSLKCGLATLALTVGAMIGGAVSFRKLGIITLLPASLHPLIKAGHRYVSGTDGRGRGGSNRNDSVS